MREMYFMCAVCTRAEGARRAVGAAARVDGPEHAGAA